MGLVLCACEKAVPHPEPVRMPAGHSNTESFETSDTPVVVGKGKLLWIEISLGEMTGGTECSARVPPRDNVVYLEGCDWKSESLQRQAAKNLGDPLLAKERLAVSRLAYHRGSMGPWVKEARLEVSHCTGDYLCTKAWARVSMRNAWHCPENTSSRFIALDVPLSWVTKKATDILHPVTVDWNTVAVSNGWECAP